MTTPQTEYNEDVITISNPERILCDGRRIARTSTAVQAVRSTLIAPRSLAATSEKMEVQISKAENEDMFHDVTDSHLTEENPRSRTLHHQFRSSYRLEDAVQEQIASILTLVKDIILRKIGTTSCAIEVSQETRVISMIQTVENLSVTKAL